MINLTERTLPDSVMVDGRVFYIQTDFRAWIRFERDLKRGVDFDCKYLFVNEYPPRISIKTLLAFARPERELPRTHGDSDVISLDFDIDADYIYSAFMEQYHIDLLEVEMHWYKFLALLNGLNENVTLSKIIGYRNYKKPSGKGKDPYMELKRAWEIEPPMTETEKQEIEEFESQFL